MSQAALVHPSPQQLAAFSLGRLKEAAALPVADHLAGCTTCRQVVENTPSDTFLHWLRAARGSAPASSAGGPPPAKAVETKDEPPSQPPAAEGSMSLPAQFGRYRIVRKLGEGGMGAVYLARDTQLDRQVALKVPHFRPGTNAPVFERFYREARAAAVFDHPNLCPVFDVGCIDGIHFLTMPFIEGKALADFIVPGKPLAPRRVAALVRKLALALQEAHGRGVIHRDLKPANILINRRQEPVIMDFGLARLEAGPEGQLTAAGTLLGTPAYMSPEQVLAEPAAIGPACDIYTLGVILYQLLTGRLPFEGPVTAILGRILTEEPPPVSHWRPEVDAALAAICRQAMAKQVADRHASMADLARALTDYLQPASPIGVKPGQVAAEQRAAPGLHVVQPQPPRPIGSRVKPPDVPVSPPRPKTTGKWRRPLWLGLAAGAAGFVLLLLGIVLLLPTPKGTIKIELSDPKAQVEVNIDKDIYTLTTLGKPLRFRVGEHDLIVTGENFETITRKFTVRRGDNPVYTVELVPKKTVAAGKPPEPPQPAKTLPPPKLPVAWGDTPDFFKAKELVGHAGQVHGVAFSADGKRAITGSPDKTACVWDPDSGDRLAQLIGHTNWVVGVALSPDGKLALTGGADEAVILWDVDSGKILQRLHGHQGAVRCTAFSPDGRYAASAGDDKIIRLYDVAKRTEIKKLEGHLDVVSSVAFSPQSAYLVSGSWDNTVRRWDLATGQQVKQYLGHTGWVQSVAYSPDGRRLLSGSGGAMKGATYHGQSDCSVRLWDVNNGKELLKLSDDWGGVCTVAFLPDSRYILFAEWRPFRADRFLFLWDTETNQEVARYQDPNDWAPTVSVATNGRHVLIGRSFNADKAGHLLRLPRLPAAK